MAMSKDLKPDILKYLVLYCIVTDVDKNPH